MHPASYSPRRDVADRRFPAHGHRVDAELHEPHFPKGDMRWKMKERTAVHAMHAHPTIYASESSGKNILHNTFSATDYFHHFPQEKRRTMEEVRIQVRPMHGPHDDANAGMGETMRSVGDTSAAWFPSRPKPGKLRQLLRRSDSALDDEENLRLAFREIDNGNRGSITQKEMLWALRRCGINVKQSTLTTLLEYMDKDPDADISETDFVQFFGQLRSLEEQPSGLLSLAFGIVAKICTALFAVALFILALIFARLDKNKDPDTHSLLAALIAISSVALGIVVVFVVAGPALTLVCNFFSVWSTKAYNSGSAIKAKAVDYIQERQKTKVKKPVKKKLPVKIVSEPINAPMRSYREIAQGRTANARVLAEAPVMAPSIVYAPTRNEANVLPEDLADDASGDPDQVTAISPIGMEHLLSLEPDGLQAGDMGYSPDTTFLRPD